MHTPQTQVGLSSETVNVTPQAYLAAVAYNSATVIAALDPAHAKGTTTATPH